MKTFLINPFKIIVNINIISIKLILKFNINLICDIVELTNKF